ncbi:hypothetical protein PoB_007462700 [Plakobranchus ocellatus]|uniref:Saposin B-type domain-containing protein n=1 Tax=Plakobranchus ocellatus TaxID=259542 RepID=A0AAV4DUY7_9GAST|nr:hypothetical protein PoB_007462700 [Plakobranchus ocellatus]
MSLRRLGQYKLHRLKYSSCTACLNIKLSFFSVQSDGQDFRVYSSVIETLRNNPDIQACEADVSGCEDVFGPKLMNTQSLSAACTVFIEYFNCSADLCNFDSDVRNKVISSIKGIMTNAGAECGNGQPSI